MIPYVRNPPQLLVIECIRSMDGLHYHHSYQGRLRIKSFGFDDMVTDFRAISAMRKFPLKVAAVLEGTGNVEDAYTE